MKKMSKKSIALYSALAVVTSVACTAFLHVGALNDDIIVIPDTGKTEYVREVDFSKFNDDDFSANEDTTVYLAEGIKFVTSGSSYEKPKIETGTWQTAEAGTYRYRLNTNGAGRWTTAGTELRRAIVIENVKAGDRIEIVYGTVSKWREMCELIGLDGSGRDGLTVLTAPSIDIPYKYERVAEQDGTYCYYDPEGTYHIYAVKVTSNANPAEDETKTDDDSDKYKGVREVDLSKLSDSDFSADESATVVLAEGIKFITAVTSDKPVIESGSWSSADAGTYNLRLNTKGGGKWTTAKDQLQRAIIIEDVQIGDKIEIAYGSSSKNRTLNELIGIDGKGKNGPAVLTATSTHTPFKYTKIAEVNGTYYYYDPNGTYHIYSIKVLSGSSIDSTLKLDILDTVTENDMIVNKFTLANVSNAPVNDLSAYTNAFKEIDNVGNLVLIYSDGAIETIKWVDGEPDLNSVERFYPALTTADTSKNVYTLNPGEFINGYFISAA